MTNPTNLVRSLLIYGLCVPLALFLGYLMSQDIRDPTTIMALAVFAALLVSPLLLKWHHAWLITSWNMSAIIFFVPGNPPLWMAMAAISIFLVVLRYTLNQEQKIIHVPSITWSLLGLCLLVLIIAQVRGGIGLRSFGSEVYGGKRYFLIWGAVLGYFALVSQRVSPNKALLYTTLFFLGGTTMAIGSLLGVVHPSLNWLFYIFPPEYVVGIGAAQTATGMMRSWALPFMSIGVVCALLARYGLSGVTKLTSPWRVVVLVGFTFLGMMGGFRSMVVLLLLTFAILFYLEGLVRSRMLPAVLVLALLVGTLMLSGVAMYLPMSVQRSLAVLPIPIDPIAKYDARGSSEWRLRMWRDLWPQVPEYLLVGKGYLFSATDAQLVLYSLQAKEGTQGSEMVGDYHNGPLSVIIPFGIPGSVLFLWFIFGGLRVTYCNYKYGPPELLNLNRFFFALFLARTIFFFGVFGSFYSELAIFTGLLGLNISINGGVAKRQRAPVPEPVEAPVPAPVAVRRPVLGFAGRASLR